MLFRSRSDIGAGTGSGTVTSVTSANSDIGVVTGTTTPVLTLATGTGTGSLVRATSPTLVTPNIGAPTASGTITSTITSNSFLDVVTASTSRKYGLITNTGGYFVFGVEPSTGGGIVAGSAAYSTSIGTGTATDLNLSTNGAIRQKILSTGDTEFSGNISAANLASGTYTPSLTNVTNVSTSSVGANSQYMRVGNTVFVYGYMTFTQTSTGDTFIGISLPIASNFGVNTQAIGTGTLGVDSSGQSVSILADTTNDRAQLSFSALTGGTSNSIVYSFSYQIL